MINTSGAPPCVDLGTAIGAGLVLFGVGLEIGASTGTTAGWLGLVLTMVGVAVAMLNAIAATARRRRRASVRP